MNKQSTQITAITDENENVTLLIEAILITLRQVAEQHPAITQDELMSALACLYASQINDSDNPQGTLIVAQEVLSTL